MTESDVELKLFTEQPPCGFTYEDDNVTCQEAIVGLLKEVGGTDVIVEQQFENSSISFDPDEYDGDKYRIEDDDIRHLIEVPDELADGETEQLQKGPQI